MPPTRDKISTPVKVIVICAFLFILDNCESAVASENISITHIEESCIQKCPDHVSGKICLFVFVHIDFNVMFKDLIELIILEHLIFVELFFKLFCNGRHGSNGNFNLLRRTVAKIFQKVAKLTFSARTVPGQGSTN